MNKKLAVLISGSYRNFDETWKINKEILDELEIPYEVFFHTWDANPDLELNVLEYEFKNRIYQSIFQKSYASFDKQIDKETLEKKFKFRYLQVDTLPERLLAEKYNLGDYVSNLRYQPLLNSCAMYFAIDLCRKEMLKDDSFSHFLRIRTDFRLDDNRLSDLFQKDLVFFGQLLPTNEGLIGDQCFGGLIESAVQVLDLMETLQEITKSSDWDVTKPMVLAEEVIRRRVLPLRGGLNIAHLQGSGTIVRPCLQGRNFSIKFILKVIAHNTKVLLGLKNRFLARIRRSLQFY
jgi:hypothetical protein